jgi:hypothetical protein
LEPAGLFGQQRVLASQMGDDIGICVVEQRAHLVEWQPDGSVHQHQMQPLDVGVGVAAVAGRSADAGYHKTDVVVVVQGADGDARDGGYRTDGLRGHAVTIDPDVT